jgi:UPF0176 protein
MREVISRAERRARVRAAGRERVTVSFYRYVRIDNVQALRDSLLSAWGPAGFDCFGRIYVASEGINAQMNVPRDRWDDWNAWVQAHDLLTDIPYKIAVSEGEDTSFYKLTVKIKDKIVADGLDDDSFDVTDTGAYLSAAEFNDYIDDPDAVVVDMRNAYESEVGHFSGAITPQVQTFREELVVAPELLRVHQNKKIALYCTGGIRCEKASAWLRHNGFTDVRHLRGGIINYKHQVDEEGLPNKFRGKNFVFDERLGERINDEVIATCHQCRRVPSDTHRQCRLVACCALYIGCDDCQQKHQSYCTRRCRVADQLPTAVKKRYAQALINYRRRRGLNKAPLARR